MTDLRTAAQQALEAMRSALHVGFDESSESQIKKADKALRQHWSAIRAIEAALAQHAEPWERRVALAEQLQMQQAEPLTIERLRDALVASRIIPPAAVEESDEYDDGLTLFRIEALHRRIT